MYISLFQFRECGLIVATMQSDHNEVVKTLQDKQTSSEEV